MNREREPHVWVVESDIRGYWHPCEWGMHRNKSDSQKELDEAQRRDQEKTKYRVRKYVRQS